MFSAFLKRIIIIVGFVGTIIYLVKMRRSVPEGEVTSESLSKKEKIMVWIFCFLNPILAGAVFYYGWKRKLPIKAKEANKISIGAFSIEVILGILSIFLTGK